MTVSKIFVCEKCSVETSSKYIPYIVFFFFKCYKIIKICRPFKYENIDERILCTLIWHTTKQNIRTLSRMSFGCVHCILVRIISENAYGVISSLSVCLSVCLVCLSVCLSVSRFTLQCTSIVNFSDTGLSGGAIAGIIIGSIVGVAVLIFLFYECAKQGTPVGTEGTGAPSGNNKIHLQSKC